MERRNFLSRVAAIVASIYGGLGIGVSVADQPVKKAAISPGPCVRYGRCILTAMPGEMSRVRFQNGKIIDAVNRISSEIESGNGVLVLSKNGADHWFVSKYYRPVDDK